jgi:hypothetical protein
MAAKAIIHAIFDTVATMQVSTVTAAATNAWGAGSSPRSRTSPRYPGTTTAPERGVMAE